MTSDDAGRDYAAMLRANIMCLRVHMDAATLALSRVVPDMDGDSFITTRHRCRDSARDLEGIADRLGQIRRDLA